MERNSERNRKHAWTGIRENHTSSRNDHRDVHRGQVEMRVKRTGHVALPKINIYICIFLKEILARRETRLSSIWWMKERSTMEKSCLLFFEEDDQKHFRPILFRFSNNYLHPIGWPSALEIRLSVVNWNKWKIDIYYGWNWTNRSKDRSDDLA